IGLFLLGTGLSVLQVAVNPFVTLLGPVNKAATRINIMGACNKLAGILAPLLFGAIILSDASTLTAQLELLSGIELENKLNQLARRVILPYSGLAALLVILAFVVRAAHLPKIAAFDIDQNGPSRT